MSLLIQDIISQLPSIQWVRGGVDPHFLAQPVSGILSSNQNLETLTKGQVFVAIRGARFDMHQHLANIPSDLILLWIVESEDAVPQSYSQPVLKVPCTRQALALLQHAWYGHPSHSLFLFGVTGTNGKTSTCQLFAHFMNKKGIPCATIGTLGHFFAGQGFETANTTPGPGALNERLQQFASAGAQAVAMEVSSHALDQHRVTGLSFDVVAFTNLTQDHLDYHGTMDAYFQSKAQLFKRMIDDGQKARPLAVLNLGDPWIQQLKVSSRLQVVSVGPEFTNVNWAYRVVRRDFEGIEFELIASPESCSTRLCLPLLGDFNIQNFLIAGAWFYQMGHSWEQLQSWLQDFEGIPGRMQKVKAQNQDLYAKVYIDFAHTPDALEHVLKTLVQIRQSQSQDCKIYVVFGAGGNRDKSKRPLMGQVASQWADVLILTSDNPRDEDPGHIINEIQQGIMLPNVTPFSEDRVPLRGHPSTNRPDAATSTLPSNVTVHIEEDRARAIE